MKLARESVDSYDQLNTDDGMPAGQEALARVKFGADVIVQKKGPDVGDNQGNDATENCRIYNINKYEIQKYMQKDIKSIQLLKVCSHKRVSASDSMKEVKP